MMRSLCVLALAILLPLTSAAQYIGGSGDGHASAIRGPAHFTYSGMLSLSGTAGTQNDHGWRMLALPVAGLTRGDIADDLNLTAETGSAVYTFDGSSFTALNADSDPLPLGRGFLLYLFDDATEQITDAGITLDIPGNPLVAPVPVAGLGLNDQWHLLGNPFDLPFDLSTLGLAAAGFQETVQIWDPRTESWTPISVGPGIVDDLAAFQGFLVERTALGAGQTSLTFPNSGRRVFGQPLVGGKGHGETFQLRLELESHGAGESRDVAARIHFSDGALPAWDPMDATRLTPLGSDHYAVLAFLGTRSGTPVDQVQISFPTSWEGQAVFPLAIRTRGDFKSHRLSWPDLTELPSDWTLKLYDPSAGKVVDLRQTNEYWLSDPSEEASLSLVISPAAATVDGIPGEGILLNRAYPNPFTSTAMLEVTVVLPQFARLSVFDLLGRRVVVLHDGPLDAGRHGFTLNGTALASGAYVAVLETRSFRESRVLVRR